MKTVVLVILYLVAVVSELAGVFLLKRESTKARTAMDGYLAANPEKHAGGSLDQIAHLQPVVVTLLGNQVRRFWAVALIVLGILAGAAGNFVSI